MLHVIYEGCPWQWVVSCLCDYEPSLEWVDMLNRHQRRNAWIESMTQWVMPANTIASALFWTSISVIELGLVWGNYLQCIAACSEARPLRLLLEVLVRNATGSVLLNSLCSVHFGKEADGQSCCKPVSQNGIKRKLSGPLCRCQAVHVQHPQFELIGYAMKRSTLYTKTKTQGWFHWLPLGHQ